MVLVLNKEEGEDRGLLVVVNHIRKAETVNTDQWVRYDIRYYQPQGGGCGGQGGGELVT